MNKLVNKWRLIDNEMAQVEQCLQRVIETAGPEIAEVGSYIFNGTGKRVRPALFLLAAYSPRQRPAQYVEGATALELIHTASLLHDDVIDQAATRRGKDAVHVRWNNKISVLTGDYLLSQAFKKLVGYHDWRLMDIVVGIVQNMTEGEIEQAFATTETDLLEEKYFNWIGKKSASFFAGCCRAGSLLAGEDRDKQDLWSQFGFNLGIAFQLIDDLLDYTGAGKVIGKPLYGDLNNRVITLPLIRTLHESSEIRKTEPIGRILHDDRVSANQISALAQAVLEGDGPAYTYSKAEEYVKRAEALIEEINPLGPNKKEALLELTRDVLRRKK